MPALSSETVTPELANAMFLALCRRNAPNLGMSGRDFLARFDAIFARHGGLAGTVQFSLDNSPAPNPILGARAARIEHLFDGIWNLVAISAFEYTGTLAQLRKAVVDQLELNGQL